MALSESLEKSLTSYSTRSSHVLIRRSIQGMHGIESSNTEIGLSRHLERMPIVHPERQNDSTPPLPFVQRTVTVSIHKPDPKHCV